PLALPVGMFASVVPWWRADHPALALTGVIWAGSALLSVLVLAGPWRRHRFGPAGVSAALVAGLLLGEAATGSKFQLASPLAAQLGGPVLRLVEPSVRQGARLGVDGRAVPVHGGARPAGPHRVDPRGRGDRGRGVRVPLDGRGLRVDAGRGAGLRAAVPAGLGGPIAAVAPARARARWRAGGAGRVLPGLAAATGGPYPPGPVHRRAPQWRAAGGHRAQ